MVPLYSDLMQLVMFVWWEMHEMRWEQWSSTTLTLVGLEYALIQNELTTAWLRDNQPAKNVCRQLGYFGGSPFVDL